MKQAFYFIVFIAFVIIMLFFSGCSTYTRVVPVTQTTERVITDTVHDTRIDSIYVAHYVRERGDTMHIIDTVYKFKILHEIETQTEFVRDSIPYTVEVQVPVRTRNGYDIFTSWGFWILFLLTAGRVAWWIVKKVYLKR